MTLKRLTYFAFAALLLGLSGLVACQKGTQTSGYQTQGSLTATVGSTNFAPSLTEAVYSPITYTTFAVIGLQPAKDSTYLRVELPLNGFTIGTPFSSDTATTSGLSWFDSERSYEYDALFGNFGSHSLIDITSWDSVNRKVAGTFSGVLYNISNGSDSIVITNGTFNTTYTEE
jgi:hypothetical protein